MQDARQPLSVNTTFGEIVVRAVLYRLPCGFFIICRGKDQDQRMWRYLKHPVECVDSLSIGKRQVKQNDIDPSTAQPFKRIGKEVHLFDTKLAFSRFCKCCQYPSGIGGIVFDE